MCVDAHLKSQRKCPNLGVRELYGHLTPDRKARFELTSIKLGNTVLESHLGC